MISKQAWHEKARELMKVYRENLRKNPDFTYRDLAKLTGFSHGTIGNYLTIASWLVTHEHDLLKLKTMVEAMAFIKAKEYSRRIRE